MARIFLKGLILFAGLMAQEFEVTPAGLRDANDLEKSYVVIDVAGKSANELYSKSVKYVNESRNDADASIKGQIDNEYLRFATNVPKFIQWRTGARADVRATFDIELRFKDERIRFEFTNISMPGVSSKYHVLFSGNKWTDYPIFDEKGNLYAKREKQLIQDFFNIIVKDYKDFIAKDNSINDDW